jgi:hypothetical protein
MGSVATKEMHLALKVRAIVAEQRQTCRLISRPGLSGRENPRGTVPGFPTARAAPPSPRAREGMQLEARFADAFHPAWRPDGGAGPAVPLARRRQAPFFGLSEAQCSAAQTSMPSCRIRRASLHLWCGGCHEALKSTAGGCCRGLGVSGFCARPSRRRSSEQNHRLLCMH